MGKGLTALLAGALFLSGCKTQDASISSAPDSNDWSIPTSTARSDPLDGFNISILADKEGVPILEYQSSSLSSDRPLVRVDIYRRFAGNNDLIYRGPLYVMGSDKEAMPNFTEAIIRADLFKAAIFYIPGEVPQGIVAFKEEFRESPVYLFYDVDPGNHLRESRREDNTCLTEISSSQIEKTRKILESNLQTEINENYKKMKKPEPVHVDKNTIQL